jgi:hypothetical protein
MPPDTGPSAKAMTVKPWAEAIAATPGRRDTLVGGGRRTAREGAAGRRNKRAYSAASTGAPLSSPELPFANLTSALATPLP